MQAEEYRVYIHSPIIHDEALRQRKIYINKKKRELKAIDVCLFVYIFKSLYLSITVMS